MLLSLTVGVSELLPCPQPQSTAAARRRTHLSTKILTKTCLHTCLHALIPEAMRSAKRGSGQNLTSYTKLGCTNTYKPQSNTWRMKCNSHGCAHLQWCLAHTVCIPYNRSAVSRARDKQPVVIAPTELVHKTSVTHKATLEHACATERQLNS